MAQVKLLKLHATSALPQEFDSASDDITLASYTVTGGGPVLSGTGLDMNNQDVSDISDLSFNDPAVSTIVGTTANDTIIIDDLMGEAKENSMAVGAAVLFPVVSDAAGELDAMRVPALAGVPTATPADGGTGYLVYDSTNKNLYVWDGALWDNLENSEAVENPYTAGENLVAGDVLYISAADTASKADASDDAKIGVIGFASAAASAAADVLVKTDGIVPGLVGLTAGARYYLSTTAGGISATAPTGAGNNVVQVGFAKSATQLQIRIQYLGKRAA